MAIVNKLQYIEQLKRAGLLKEGIRLGVVSYVLIRQKEIFDHFKKVRPKFPNDKSAIIYVSIKENVSEATVWRAVHAMR